MSELLELIKTHLDNERYLENKIALIMHEVIDDNSELAFRIREIINKRW